MAVDSEAGGAGRRNGKSAAAFRTISEVADDLEVPPHVLRFWESKFTQVRPLKRGGGRRYYRPEEIGLLRRIRELLYSDGYTIKGVQRLLKDGAVKVQSPDASNGAPKTEAAPKELVADTTAEDRIRNQVRPVLEELQALKTMLDQVRD